MRIYKQIEKKYKNPMMVISSVICISIVILVILFMYFKPIYNDWKFAKELEEWENPPADAWEFVSEHYRNDVTGEMIAVDVYESLLKEHNIELFTPDMIVEEPIDASVGYEKVEGGYQYPGFDASFLSDSDFEMMQDYYFSQKIQYDAYLENQAAVRTALGSTYTYYDDCYVYKDDIARMCSVDEYSHRYLEH